RPAVTRQATPTTAKAGQTVAFTGTVVPALSGVTAWLQTKRDGVWSDTRKVPLDGSGTFRVSWAAVAGVTAARLRVPATESLLAGRSQAVALVIK
ncbi:MAG TPA: hypothetical protein VLA35_09435, partial [Thermoleophilia bacterium]|nr:hypothetical protein [Thermoleophilia bacterium]